jgi:KUP system potassium uptake protein
LSQIRNRSSSQISASLAALGVVFGDIGTSPLYAMRECFTGSHGVALNTANIFGVLSLILWSLIFVVSVKYLAFVMRADNKGEGGILALMALLMPKDDGKVRKYMQPVIAMGLAGAVLLYGDGIITPAITVLGAVEGLKVVTPLFEPYVMLISLAIISGLFLIQSKGTATIGKVFGPVILLWFVVLAVMGVYGISMNTGIIGALNPVYGVSFLVENKYLGFVVLGSIFLVVTGGEALYADMGHFGLKPIQMGWFFVALPSLLLHYFGQGALLLTAPAAIENPFYALAPAQLIYPLVVLSTAAAVIASQALITGAFSLTQQAVHLGFLPRIKIKHTSAEEQGQIYIPFANWALMIGTLLVVIMFKTSSALAAAYGIAVTGTMAITTILTCLVAYRIWKWNIAAVLTAAIVLLTIDLAFLGANALKIVHGGWFPLLLGMGLFVVMTTWKRGRQILATRLLSAMMPLDRFIAETIPLVKFRVPGVAVLLTGRAVGTPPALAHNLKMNKIIHEKVILLTVVTLDTAHCDIAHELLIEPVGPGFYRVIARYGFMDEPNIPNIVKLCQQMGVPVDPSSAIYILGRETLIATDDPGMSLWREKLFAFMNRNAQSAMTYFLLPETQVIEIGVQVRI